MTGYRRLFALISVAVPSAAGAATLIDTGQTSAVALHAAYDEYFTCDEDGDHCSQDYELVTSEASRFHIAAGGTGAAITLAAAHEDGFDFYTIYRDADGALLPDPAHRLWSSGYDPAPIVSSPLTGPGYDAHHGSSLDTYDLGNLALAAGDYWLVISVAGPTFGDEPVLFAGTAAGTNARQQYFDNQPGPYDFVDFTGRQASIRIDGMLDATQGVPEPGTWSLMIAGFGLTGFALRRQGSATGRGSAPATAGAGRSAAPWPFRNA